MFDVEMVLVNESPHSSLTTISPFKSVTSILPSKMDSDLSENECVAGFGKMMKSSAFAREFTLAWEL